MSWYHVYFMNTIFVRNLILSGTHGAHLPAQARLPISKDFRVNIEIDITSIDEAVATDDIRHVYDYRHAVAIAQRVIEGTSVHLIETLATRIVQEIKKHPEVLSVTVTISKREPHDAFDSGITLRC